MTSDLSDLVVESENDYQVTDLNALEVMRTIKHDFHLNPEKFASLLGMPEEELIEYLKGRKELFSKTVLDKLTYLKNQFEIINSYDILFCYKYLDRTIKKYGTSLYKVLVKGDNIEKYAAALKEQSAYREENYYRAKKNSKKLSLDGCVDIYSIRYTID